MNIGVIGCGRMGRSLGLAMERIGHAVMFGSRHPERLPEALTLRGTYRDAALFADVIILATPWEHTSASLEAAGRLDEKIVLSCVNPATDDSPLAIGHVTSAAEEIARWASRARVIEAFNGTYAEAVDLAPRQSSETVLYCGDDPGAADVVSGLIRALGFDSLNAGPLRNARYLEPLASLIVHLVRTEGYGPLGIHCEWKRGSR